MQATKNILLIICDQLRPDFLEAYGGPAVTPNISRLARQSIVFDRAYSSSPSCIPARMSLLTGMHSLACPHKIPGKIRTTAEILADKGYDTAALGKMHMSPVRGPYGFRKLMLSEDTGDGMFLDDYHRELAENGFSEWDHGLTNYDILETDGCLPEEKTVTRWNGDQAVNHLRECARNKRQFFSVVSFVKPHPPYDPIKKWKQTVEHTEIPKPVGIDRGSATYPFVVSRYKESAETGNFTDTTVNNIRTAYLALIAQIDEQVGNILDTLESENLVDNTLVCFTSDHGDSLGDHRLFMKFFSYEGSARIPLMIRAREIAPSRCHRPVSTLDIPPLFLDYAGLPPVPWHQGRSLIKIPEDNHRESILISSQPNFGSSFTLVTEKYKYTFWPNGEKELYDTNMDPHEKNNIAANNNITRELHIALQYELERINKQRLTNVPPFMEQGEILTRKYEAELFTKVRSRYCHHKKMPYHGY
ncbi:MAG TPA: hypothetical protein DC049_10955 [Spirochaetia bacterium]|nr:hypothetical protein [Spirochaetia bacterium]